MCTNIKNQKLAPVIEITVSDPWDVVTDLGEHFKFTGTVEADSLDGESRVIRLQFPLSFRNRQITTVYVSGRHVGGRFPVAATDPVYAVNIQPDVYREGGDNGERYKFWSGSLRAL